MGQDAIDLAGGDVDAELTQLFEQERLGDIAVVILVEDVTLQDGSKVTGAQLAVSPATPEYFRICLHVSTQVGLSKMPPPEILPPACDSKLDLFSAELVVPSCRTL